MLLHIAERALWLAAQATGDYRPPSLAGEGFIHCSRPNQILAVAEALFTGREDLVLLVIDPERLTAAVVDEDCYAAGQTFPHLYGPLNLAAVVAVHDFAPGPDGRFRLPGL